MVRMPAPELQALLQRQPTVSTATVRPPDFWFLVKVSRETTAESLALGGVGGVLTGSALEEARRNDLKRRLFAVDPVDRVRAGMTARLTRELAPLTFTPYEESFERDDAATMAPVFGERLVMDFKTIDWSMRGEEAGPIVLSYIGRARVFRPSDNSVLWEGRCRCDEPPTATAAPLADFMSNRGVLLATRFAALADACTGQLVGQFFDRADPAAPPP